MPFLLQLGGSAKIKFELPAVNSNLQVTDNFTEYNMTFRHLQANQRYAFLMSVIYKKHFQHYYWPTITDVRYVYKTAGNIAKVVLFYVGFLCEVAISFNE